jgi:hypothetical protein
MGILKDNQLLPLGMVCLAIALVAERFISPLLAIDFFLGVLDGMAVTLMLFGLYRTGRVGTLAQET